MLGSPMDASLKIFCQSVFAEYWIFKTSKNCVEKKEKENLVSRNLEWNDWEGRCEILAGTHMVNAKYSASDTHI